MRNFLKFVATLIVTFLLMFAFRALAFTIFTVPMKGLEPTLEAGDRVLVNRWSYGLRTGNGCLFSYARWMKQPVHRGDMVVFNNPLDTTCCISNRAIFACPCRALPGDTVWFNKQPIVIPGKCRMVRVEKYNVHLLCNTYRMHEHRNAKVINDTLYVDGKEIHCALFTQNYYWMGSVNKHNLIDSRYFGLVPESHIIGRAVAVLYSKDPHQPFYKGYSKKRILLSIE